MKQSKGFNGEQKKTTNRATMGPIADIDSQAQIIWDILRESRHLVWGPTHCCAIKKQSKVINHNWISNHACSFPLNIHIASYLFVAS